MGTIPEVKPEITGQLQPVWHSPGLAVAASLPPHSWGTCPPLRVLTPQDGALLGRLQNQTFWLAGLASRRKLFLLYSRKRHWKTLTTYQHRCRTRGHSPWRCQPGGSTFSAALPVPAPWDGLPQGGECTNAIEQSQILHPGNAHTRTRADIENPVQVCNSGKQSSYPFSPGLIPYPFPPTVKKSFQICRLNTFFVHFRPFTLYPTSLRSNNIFPSFYHSIT